MEADRAAAATASLLAFTATVEDKKIGPADIEELASDDGSSDGGDDVSPSHHSVEADRAAVSTATPQEITLEGERSGPAVMEDCHSRPADTNTNGTSMKETCENFGEQLEAGLEPVFILGNPPDDSDANEHLLINSRHLEDSFINSECSSEGIHSKTLTLTSTEAAEVAKSALLTLQLRQPTGATYRDVENSAGSDDDDNDNYDDNGSVGTEGERLSEQPPVTDECSPSSFPMEKRVGGEIFNEGAEEVHVGIVHSGEMIRTKSDAAAGPDIDISLTESAVLVDTVSSSSKRQCVEGGTQTSPRLEKLPAQGTSLGHSYSDPPPSRTVTFSPLASVRKDSITAEVNSSGGQIHEFTYPLFSGRTSAHGDVLTSLTPLKQHRMSDPTRRISQQGGSDSPSFLLQQRLSDPTRRLAEQGRGCSPTTSMQHVTDVPGRVRSWSASPQLLTSNRKSFRSPSPSRRRGDSHDSVEYSATDEWFRRITRPAPESLRYALRSVDKKYSSKGQEIGAASKISVWWKLMYPQKKLHRRMLSRAVCLDVVLDVVEVTLVKCHTAYRKRYWMMRQGAAIMIQRLFRYWKYSFLVQVVKIQRAYRRSCARSKVTCVVTSTRAAVLVARFIYRNRLRHKKIVGKKKLYRVVIRNFIDVIGCRVRDEKARQINLLASISSQKRRTTMISRIPRDSNNEIYLRRFKACIKIQSIFRMAQARGIVEDMFRDKRMRSQISVWLSMVRLRRKLHARRIRNRAAIVMQRFWRGSCCRWRMMLHVLAGVRIVSTWRRHRQYWKLKHCLRRNETPLEVTFHGIRNIPANQFKSGVVRIRVSVWWSDLLHLVGKNEHMTVMQSKRPNIVRTTSFHVCQEQKIAPRLIAPVPKMIAREDSDRKMSLAQRTQKLMPQNCCNGTKLDAASALVMFAKTHGVRGAHVKMAGGGSREESGDVAPAPLTIDTARARRNFQSIVKKSVSLGVLMKLQEKVKEASAENDSDSNSSSSSDEESDNDGFDDDAAAAQLPAGRARASSAPKAVQERVPFDKIGRESVNALGMNLLESGSTESLRMGVRGAAKNLLSSLTALDITPTAPPKRSLQPVPRKGAQELSPPVKGTPSGSGSGSPIDVKNRMNSALKKALSPKAPVVSSAAANFFRVDLEDEELYVPGLHGNSVLRFDVYDGE